MVHLTWNVCNLHIKCVNPIKYVLNKTLGSYMNCDVSLLYHITNHILGDKTIVC